MENGQGEELLKKAYDKLKDSGAEEARAVLEQALGDYYENDEIKHALKCVNWWLENTKGVDALKNPYEKGCYIISLFKKYYAFLGQFNSVYDQCQYAVRYFVYSKALFFFKGLLVNIANQNDHGLLLMVGRCYKGLGNYDEALGYLEQALVYKKEDAETLAEAADINALLSQTKIAKALFREAFFIDPSKINLRCMESALILTLRDKVAEMGIKEEEICEWIPVYGYLFGVFSVKRELKQTEVGRLKQSIFSLEAECEANHPRREILKPRLLNQYFWLIDHYEKSHEDSSLIEEAMLRIKVTDPDIYKMYTGK